MNKIYEDEFLTIYNNDYRDIINDITFDYIITDPPYNIGYKYNNYNDNLSEEDYIKLLEPLKNQKIVFIHHIKALIQYFSIPNKITPIDNFVWAYNSNLERQHRDIVFYNVKPNKKNVGMEYLNKNDKRIKKRIAEGKFRKMTTWFSDINIVKNTSKEKYGNFTNQIPISLYERIINLISIDSLVETL